MDSKPSTPWRRPAEQDTAREIQAQILVRARGEHALQVTKHLWGHRKVRYRGLAKNLAQAFTLFALAKRYLLRRFLRPQVKYAQ